MSQKFWMVWVHDTPTTKKRHTTLESAMKEAERVARQPTNVDKKVYILESRGYCHIERIPVAWHTL